MKQYMSRDSEGVFTLHVLSAGMAKHMCMQCLQMSEKVSNHNVSIGKQKKVLKCS